jgi:hypothetical protein
LDGEILAGAGVEVAASGAYQRIVVQIQGAGDPIDAWIRALRSRPRMKGRLTPSGGQPQERLQTDVRALHAIVAADPQDARPAGDALAAAP